MMVFFFTGLLKNYKMPKVKTGMQMRFSMRTVTVYFVHRLVVSCLLILSDITSHF